MKKLLMIIFFLVISLVVIKNNAYEEIIIPNESIRIRVIANSNSIEDQQIKKQVKKSVEIELANMLKDCKNINDVRNVLKNNLSNVNYTVENELKKQNTVNNQYEVNYGYNFFPEKKYKGITYTEGNYESVVIKLGKAEGDNWWCVLFPPLCLIDEEDIENVEYKSFVKEIIEQYF